MFSPFAIFAGFVGLAFSFAVWQVLHLSIVLTWGDQQTLGARYYTRPAAWRRRFKRLLRLHSVLLSPILALLGRTSRPEFSQRSMRYAGVAGPAGACTCESFRRAAAYDPRPEDVFVVTQMRSGTTWMQHLVYQVLTRGEGDLVAADTPLNAVSPWIESIRTIGIDDAPRVGRERPSRIIKTHLPLALCPFDRHARYIYVARHPLACFASCVDFVRGNLQGFAPDWRHCARWFQSDDLMWWGTWVAHVGHWQRHADLERNVLFVRYEDLGADLPAVAQRVAAHLGLAPLAPGELAPILEKCSHDYMRRHAGLFEMHPPHLLQAKNPFFSSRGPDRAGAVPTDIASELLDWARYESAALGFPLARLYPDLALPLPDSAAIRPALVACR
jgi:hypothetical protein